MYFLLNMVIFQPAMLVYQSVIKKTKERERDTVDKSNLVSLPPCQWIIKIKKVSFDRTTKNKKWCISALHII